MIRCNNIDHAFGKRFAQRHEVHVWFVAHPRQLLSALLLQFAVEQLLLGGLQIAGGLVEGLAHVLAEGGQGLVQQGVEAGVGGGSSSARAGRLTITGLAQHQQGQFTGDGSALHQALLEGMGE